MSSVNSQPEPWYGVRSLFYDKENNHYEERTILLEASSSEEALEFAKKNAEQYAQDIGGMEYTGYSDSFHIFENIIKSGTEVFSLIRKTDIGKDDYINRFLDSGLEHRSNHPA